MDIFEDTSLNDISKLGGMGPVGSASLGGTVWTDTKPLPAPDSFQDTSLNDIAKLGGMGPVGAGSLGGTVWEDTE